MKNVHMFEITTVLESLKIELSHFLLYKLAKFVF